MMTRELRGQWAGHRGGVTSLAFSPDGKSLVSGSADTTALVWDLTGLAENGEFRTGRLSPSELQVLWEELAASPSSRATKALWKLVASPDDCVPFLRRKLRIVAPVDSRTIDERIGDLADDRFPVRKRAMDELEKIGEAAEPALRRALENRPGPEMRQRVEQLLGYFEARRHAGALAPSSSCGGARTNRHASGG